MPEPLPNGTVLADRFRIVRLLGMGGMGAVYEIVHELTRHRRALKLLHPQWVVHQDVVDRFIREASAAGRIGNPHIIETFDAGQLDGGEPYLVMELLAGLTLTQRITETGGLPIRELVEVFSQACAGVQAAHDAGIIHRDLKPDNVFITSGGGRPFVKILDFGVSKFDARHTQMRETAGGQMIGTPLYMAPEQIWAEQSIDGRADVYSLGVMLYESATGVHPYPVDSMPALIARMSERKIRPPNEIRADLPAPLLEAIAKAMASDKGARFQSASELGDAVAALAGPAPIDPLGQTLPVSDPPPVVAGLAALVAEASARQAPSAAPARSEPSSAPATPTPAPLLASNPSTSVTLPRGVERRPRRTKTLLVLGAAGVAVVAIAVAASRGDQPPAPAVAGPEPGGTASVAPTVRVPEAFPDPTAAPIATPVSPSSASTTAPTSSTSASSKAPATAPPRASSARPPATGAASAKPAATGDMAGKGEYP